MLDDLALRIQSCLALIMRPKFSSKLQLTVDHDSTLGKSRSLQGLEKTPTIIRFYLGNQAKTKSCYYAEKSWPIFFFLYTWHISCLFYESFVIICTIQWLLLLLYTYIGAIHKIRRQFGRRGTKNILNFSNQ